MTKIDEQKSRLTILVKLITIRVTKKTYGCIKHNLNRCLGISKIRVPHQDDKMVSHHMRVVGGMMVGHKMKVEGKMVHMLVGHKWLCMMGLCMLEWCMLGWCKLGWYMGWWLEPLLLQ